MSYYKPFFSHPHYDSFECENSKIINVNKNLAIRSNEILEICKILNFKSIIDIGCNMGGILFYLNQHYNFSELIGVEGDPKFYSEILKINQYLNTKIKFYNKNFFQYKNWSLGDKKDCLVLQNIYHYLYDVSGNHDDIFSILSKVSNNIIWYNPIDNKDPVIGKHANTNKNTNWNEFSIKNIYLSAIKNDFYLPISLDFKFSGMGDSRHHLLFPRRNAQENETINTIDYDLLNNLDLEEYKTEDYYKPIHAVYFCSSYFYKIFKEKYFYQAEKIYELFKKKALNKKIANEIIFIKKEDKIIGYKQKKMMNYEEVLQKFLKQEIDDAKYSLYYLLFSNALKYNFLPTDFGTHNIKFEINYDGDLQAYLIDLESFITSEQQIYSENLRNYSLYNNTTDHEKIKINLNRFFDNIPDLFVNLKVEELMQNIMFTNEIFFKKKTNSQIQKIYKKIY
jgi:SAM-dependent methyltransferase